MNAIAPRSAEAVPVPVIRAMGLDDLDRVLALERLVYPSPWSEGIFRDELAAPGRVYLVAEVDGALAGFGGMMVVADEGHVTNVAVDPIHRRSRIATRLMLEMVDRGLAAGARHLTLEVRVSNRAAQRLYGRFGMAPVGVRQGLLRRRGRPHHVGDRRRSTRLPGPDRRHPPRPGGRRWLRGRRRPNPVGRP